MVGVLRTESSKFSAFSLIDSISKFELKHSGNSIIYAPFETATDKQSSTPSNVLNLFPITFV